MPIRAITFDLDDTLWPIAPVIGLAEQLMHRWLSVNCPRVTQQYSIENLRQMRVELELQRPELSHDFGLMRRTVLDQAMAPLGYDEATIEAAYQVFYSARNQVDYYPEVKPVLAQLGNRYRLAGISNGNADLQQTGLARYLDFVVQAADVGYLKPNPRMFQAALRRLGLPAPEVLHVGDHLEHDVAGARDAGMQAVWLNRDPERSPVDGLAEISSLEQLPGLIESLR